jgi:hypothetical protein
LRRELLTQRLLPPCLAPVDRALDLGPLSLTDLLETISSRA